MFEINDKKVLILGFSVTGIALAKYLAPIANVFLSEYSDIKNFKKSEIEEIKKLGVQVEFGSHSDEFIQNADFAVISPSIPTTAPILKKLEENNISYFSDIEFVYKIKNTVKVPEMVMITGTNGKTTTTLLTQHIFSQKYASKACGNIGVSPVEYLNDNLDYFILETSSYQLNYSNSFVPKVAIFTNITDDHIDFHGTSDKYFEAKASVFKRMDKNNFAILNYDDEKLRTLAQELSAKVYFFALDGSKLADKSNCAYVLDDAIYFENNKIIDTKELNIVGSHNLQNAMCAIISAKIENIEDSIIQDGLKTFNAPSHRCELIRILADTAYYNDSKATNPEASIVAINAFKGKKVVLIAGGRDKGTSLSDFVDRIKKRISKVVLIGEATKRFRQTLYENGYLNIVNAHTIEEAIDLASLDTPDVVLLSPACASFDMFDNYEQRGEAFKKYVLSKKQLVSR